jgi:hypothetical protein
LEFALGQELWKCKSKKKLLPQIVHLRFIATGKPALLFNNFITGVAGSNPGMTKPQRE